MKWKKKKMIINHREISHENPPYIIAEMSANHNGSLQMAKDTMLSAKRCGSDAIKMQSYTANTMTLNSDRPEFFVQEGKWKGRKLYDLYSEASTPFEWHEELFKFAKQIEITLFSTPFDETAVDLLMRLDTPAFKIASFELTDLDLVRYVAQTNKPTIMSTGMATDEEINAAYDIFSSNSNAGLVMLHCVSSYPADITETNLKSMTNLRDRFGAKVGLSDHTMGSLVPIAATALGACVIEKHFTLDRNLPGPDNSFSMEPKDLTELVNVTRSTWAALGKDSITRTTSEQASRKYRRSLYFVEALKAGDVIKEKDVRRVRPALGLEPKYFDAVIGKKVKADVTFATPLSWDLIE